MINTSDELGRSRNRQIMGINEKTVGGKRVVHNGHQDN